MSIAPPLSWIVLASIVTPLVLAGQVAVGRSAGPPWRPALSRLLERRALKLLAGEMTTTGSIDNESQSWSQRRQQPREPGAWLQSFLLSLAAAEATAERESAVLVSSPRLLERSAAA